MEIIFNEFGYDGRIILKDLDYLFKDVSSISLDNENPYFWSIKSENNSIYLTRKEYYRSEDKKYAMLKNCETEFIVSYNDDGTFTIGAAFEKFLEVFHRINNLSVLSDFLVNALTTNTNMYKLFLFDEQFYSDVSRIKRNFKDVEKKVFKNIIKNGLPTLEKVFSGCEYSFFVQNLCKSDMELSNEKKKLKQVLGLPPVVIEFLKNPEYVSLYPKFKEMADIKDINDTVVLVEYINLVNKIENIIQQKHSYPYLNRSSFIESVLDIAIMSKSNMTTIINYLHTQAIYYGTSGMGIRFPVSEAIEFRDYLKIAKSHNFEIDPLPSNIRAAHFYVLNNINQKNDKKEIEFVNAVSSYSHLEYEGEKYVIVAPKNIDDMILEGIRMHHCIASYVDMVCDGAIVLFLRNKDNVDESFVSFEVTRDGEFVQIKGKYDFDIERTNGDSEENDIIDFLEIWKKEKFEKEITNG